MRRFWAALVAVFFLLTIPMSAWAETENLVINPGFDEVDSSNLPRNWYRDMWNAIDGVSRLTIDPDGYEGAAIRVENVAENDARFAQDVAVVPDTLYEITAMVRAEGISAGEGSAIGANISVKDTFCYSGFVYDTGGEWVKLSLYGRTGEEQTTLTLLARVGGYSSLNVGTAWFDSFTMTEIDAVPAGAVEYDFTGIKSSAADLPDETGVPDRNTEAWLLAAFGIALIAVALLRKSGRAELRGERHYALVFAILLVASFLIRLVVAARVRGYNTDINCFSAWSERIFAVGYTNFYAKDYFCDYPPLYMALLWLVAGVRNLFGIAYGSTAHVVLIKLMPIMADAATACLVYLFAKKRVNARAAMLLGAVCALNPAAIVDSAAWGQIDSMFTIFIFLGAYFLNEERYGWALPMFTVSMLIKPQALLFAPLGLVALVVNLSLRWDAKKALRALYGLGASLALLLLAWAIFHIDGVGPFAWFETTYLATMSEGYSKLTVNTLNFFYLIGMNWEPMAENQALSVFAWVLFALSYLYASVLSIRAKKPSAIFMAGGVLIMLICAFGPMIHERYVYPGLVLLLMAYAYERDRRILYSLAILTVTLFLNQILVLQGGMTEANYGHLQKAEDWLNLPLSLLVVANAAYVSYVAFSMYFMDRRVIVEPKPLDEPSPARRGLFGKRDYRLNLRRADYLIMAGVTLAYSILTFTNLGTTSAPQTTWVSAQGEQVVFDLGETESFRMEYYGNICDVNFTVELSNDGAVWTEPQYAVYNQGQIFRWLFYYPSTNADKPAPVYGETIPTTDGSAYTVFPTSAEKYPFQTARYVRITATSAGLKLMEVGFLNANGETLPVSIASANGAALVDEQGTVPVSPSYYNSTYFDEIYHARTAYEHLHGLHTYEWTHPPLGKVMMMFGIQLFGMSPFGWRFMGALMGVFMLPVIYLMVKQLGGSRKMATLALLLFSLDAMHFTQTRIATIDSYAVFFIMLMYLFMFRYVRMSFHRQPLWKTLIPLALCGVTMGCAWAAKWIGIYASAGLAVLFFWSLVSRFREHLAAKKHAANAFESDEEKSAVAEARDHFWRNAAVTLVVCLCFFVAVPVVVYYFSYYLQLTPDGNFTVQRVIELQKQIYNYHSGLTNDDHYFQSPWYEWPVIAWPMWYFDGSDHAVAGTTSSISAMGNPAVWWTGLVAMVSTIIGTAWKRRASTVGVILTISFLSQYLPWVLVPRSTFIYHYFASVPFIIIATAFLFGKLERKRPKAFMIAAGVLVGLALLLFIFFYPVESGMSMSQSYAKYLKWFDWLNYR